MLDRTSVGPGLLAVGGHLIVGRFSSYEAVILGLRFPTKAFDYFERAEGSLFWTGRGLDLKKPRGPLQGGSASGPSH